MKKTMVKAINKIFLENDIKKIKTRPRSYPTTITLSLSNTCNLSCPMCSINNLRKKKVRRVKNNISLKQVRTFSDIFRRANNLVFMGFIGESILNPEFNEIIRYIKSNYDISLSVSTNGIGLNENIQKAMLDVGFDSIVFSIHASIPETYKILQAGNFNAVIDNLTRFANEKEQRGLSVPSITIVYALNKANIKETCQMIDLAVKRKVNELMLYHYRDHGVSTLALDKDPESANRMIDTIYSYAREKGVISILPEHPPYYERHKLEQEDSEEIKCYLPWRGLQMRGSYSHSDSYYLGCCNVFNAFLFDYERHIAKYGKVVFRKIWHHSVFQYLRETVNSTSTNERNPLCRYCKSRKRDYLKNTDNAKNYRIKLEVLKEFFEGFAEKYKNIEEVEGLEVLYSEDKELRALV